MKAVQLPSGKWNIHIKDGKTTKSFTASTRREVERLATDYIWNRDEKVDVTVGDAVDAYIKSKESILSPTTTNLYKIIRKKNLQPLMTYPISALNPVIVQTEFNREAETHKPKTLANMRGLLSAALGMYGYDLKVDIPHPIKKIIDLPEPKEVIDAVRGTDIELPCLLAIWLSLSMSEIRGLQVSSVGNGTITVQEAMVDVDGESISKEATKAYERTRRLSLPHEIFSLIQQTDAWKKGEGYLVTMNRRTIYGHFVKAIEKANLPHMTFHQLRHMNASVMEQLGVPILYAKERFGHDSNSPVLMRVYQHTFKDKRAEVDQTINSYFSNLMK